MIKFDDQVNENETEHNKNWPYVKDLEKSVKDCMQKIHMKQNINI